MTESDIEETLKRLVGELKKSPEEVFDALKNQIVDLVFTAHPTQSICRFLLQKHGRIRNCLTQLYAKDITPNDKQELDECPPYSEGDSNSNGDCGDIIVVKEIVDDDVFGMETGGNKDAGSMVAVVDDFFDLHCGSVSAGSSTGVDDFGKQVECPSFVSNQSGFFDASEGYFSSFVYIVSLNFVCCSLVSMLIWL
ncbi:Phosphoenolpyruvate carboxylase 2 [Camellia lanceoleosa]|uniref:Phosphoenolpyruvate carboxylase 2 n=1 Tax=Camellia lanceoleosa TaxID=1840588 RepID=A0ACC0G7Q0_9ERIC|nr:Phosphoenolpyruvate carboxylase 2 [Camellia lanceoleosa]